MGTVSLFLPTLWFSMPSTRPYSQSDRSGFTLVELLVVIAIIGVMVGLLLPAVQAAREAARRVQCANNLKQIGLGIHNYEATYRRIPWGAKGGWGLSWTTDILGFIEETALADIVPYGEPGGPTGGHPESQRFRQLAQTPVMTFRCPSQYGPIAVGESIDQIEGRILNSYLGIGGGNVNSDNYSTSSKIGFERGNGVFLATDFCHIVNPADDCDNVPERKAISFADILDGLSNTAMVGETRYIEFNACEICDHFSLYHPEIDAWNGQDFSEVLGSLHFGFNLNEGTLEKPVTAEMKEISLGSYHPGGLHILMCDGSVRFTNEAMNDEVRHAIGSRAQHEVIDASQF
ncbi:protein containing DUF1559 [Rhodopirellula sp. SWK7]|nr:protein containing DUF1559 [Rhodopirellula sp. SWK7]